MKKIKISMIDCKTKHIVLYGGLFNPFHDGHYALCKYIIDNEIADKVIIVIDKEKILNKNKKLIIVSLQHRLNMIKIFIKNNSKIIISKYHFYHKQKFMKNTIEYFKKKYPTSKISILIGEDQWNQFTKWYQYKWIINNVNIYVAKRKCEIIPLVGENIQKESVFFLNNDYYDFSSTKIIEGKNFKDYNRQLIKYINYFSLYALFRLQKYLKESRFLHSYNSAIFAKQYAKYHLEINKDNAYFAALYHDYFKCILNNEIKFYWIKKYGISSAIPDAAIHGPICANYLENELLITNTNIIEAIKYHTIPSLLKKE